jgi:hypothetical protein
VKRTKKRRATKRSRSRGWITILLLVLLGFFALSIYLGRTQNEANRPEVRLVDDREEQRNVPEPGSPTLVVWNGCGRDALGARAARWLRRQGFDVFEITNADRTDYRRTLIVQRSERGAAVREVADRLEERLGVGLLVQQRARYPEADALLILGSDFPDSLPIN